MRRSGAPRDPLRLGQRRLRRPRRARGRRGPRAAGPGVDLRREQARRRGADRVVLPHVRPVRAGRSASATWSARARPTASASTSSAGCSTTRRRLRILGDGRQSKSLHPRRRRRAAPCSLAPGGPPTHRSTPSTSPPATTSPSPRSPSWPSRCVGLDPATVDVRATRAATAAGRATCRSCASTPTGSARSAGAASGARREALRASMALDARRRAGRAADEHLTGPAVFLDRDGVLNRAVVRDGVPHPPAPCDEVELLPGVAEACRELAAPGWLLVVRHQPARHRPGHGVAGRRSRRINERAARPACPSTTCWSAPTTTPTAADAASRRPGCCSTPPTACGASTSAAASWSATAGATSRPAARPGSPPCSSTGATPSAGPTAPTRSESELLDAVPFILATRLDKDAS